MNAKLPAGVAWNHHATLPHAPRLAELQSIGKELLLERDFLISQLREQLQALSYLRKSIRQLCDRRPPSRSELARRLQDNFGLTQREMEVARLLAQGLSNSVLAQRLDISPHTARHHTQRVLGKLGVHSRAEAAARLRHW